MQFGTDLTSVGNQPLLLWQSDDPSQYQALIYMEIDLKESLGNKIHQKRGD
jgi:hypothetical protein